MQLYQSQPSRLDFLWREWFSNAGADLLSGSVVALALIPEAIAFSIIAGVDPKVGLYAASIIAMVTAIFGGRIGMVSAATAALAVLFTGLVKNHGLDYLFAATILTGVLQFLYGILGLGRLIRFVPDIVMSGFLNALAVLIFLAQMPQLQGATWLAYALVALALVIIYGLPKFTKAVPSSLVAISVVTALSLIFRLDLRTVGDAGELPRTLPLFHVPSVPLNLQTLWIILPVSLGASVVGLLESLLTAQVLDELTQTSSDKNRECKAQGLANCLTGFFGGMGGCAMIGQSIINFKSGGRGRLSSFAAGALLLFFMIVAGDFVRKIPMAALVGVMFMVAASTFDWKSVQGLKVTPRSEIAILAGTVIAVLWTHNLAIGVAVGIVLSLLHLKVWKALKKPNAA
ncbi:sulfate permease, SulP family [Abditibacterium utsteinense]|uniref:Sulfate permease, SulP family n=1 Tax=Abditibacterium utsteinense TaxID=1960156 RepID=A0A2S8SW55_9BACT|nr:SulP family inorganic anion transporter [Abditibacterium utsteinense]PQV65024.1 sulfate permease, SulP family [Abditibacterium utsteinense]